MREIKIFIASSIIDFKEERYELESFINQLGRDFRKRFKVDVIPFICENYDHAVISNGRMQDEFNKEIRNSEMVFFLFFNRVGDATKEEFRVAREAMAASENGRPKIYTFFKTLKAGEGVEESLKVFMHEIDVVVGHYYEYFDSLDTVKLRILLNIKMQELDFVEVTAESGWCCIGGKKYLKLENLPEYFNNGFLKELRDELKEVEKEYFLMKPIYAEGGCDNVFFKKYSRVAGRRKSLIDEIEELQKNIFKMSLNMSYDETHGMISQRQKEAYRLFELGDYEGCLAVLAPKDIDSEYKSRKQRILEELKEEARKYIREYKTRIDILHSMKSYAGRFDDITECYEKIITEAFEYGVELNVVCSYVNFLLNQKKFQRGIEVGKILLKIDEENESITDDEEAALYSIMACLYMSTNRYEEAEIWFKEAIEKEGKLAEENIEAYLSDLASNCNNLARLYELTNRYEEAEELYKEALRILGDFSENTSDEHQFALALIYNNLAVLYDKTNRYKKAENLCKESLEICKKLMERNPDAYESRVASFCNTLVFLYNSINRYEDAEAPCKEALDILRKLVKVNPDAYLPDCAISCYNLAGLYRFGKQYVESEKLYKESLEIYEKIVDDNPDVYLPRIALINYMLAILCEESGREPEANSLHHKAFEIAKKYKETDDMCRVIFNFWTFFSEF